MKDTELRGIILQKYYEHRREVLFRPESNDFNPPISDEDITAISQQLGEHGLVKYLGDTMFGGHYHHAGSKITAFGIDVVEGEATPDIKVTLVENKTINFHGNVNGENLQIGDHNQITVTQHITEIQRAIEKSNGTPEQKEEAKGMLEKISALLIPVIGGAIKVLTE